ncbi:hypothetical protein BDR05DRAFT_991614 [Suillus weaverae]|nr:hypothetical protein BDR05DRAFT_991614 [Suillus weaverae]
MRFSSAIPLAVVAALASSVSASYRVQFLQPQMRAVLHIQPDLELVVDSESIIDSNHLFLITIAETRNTGANKQAIGTEASTMKQSPTHHAGAGVPQRRKPSNHSTKSSAAYVVIEISWREGLRARHLSRSDTAMCTSKDARHTSRDVQRGEKRGCL